MSDPILTAEGLGKTFGGDTGLFGKSGEAVRAVDDVGFSVARAETLALVGESGCGKSTLGRLLLRLIDPTDGVIRFDGKEITKLSPSQMRDMRRHLQIIFQDPFGSLSPRRSIADIIAEPLEVFGLERSRRKRRDRVAELLDRVGLPSAYMDRLPRSFSGGQRQRVGIARAIATSPAFIVADEPVSALDVSIQAQIVNLLQDLQRDEGFSYLFIAHDLAVVRHIADRVAVMYLGRLVEIGPKDAVYNLPQHPYTQALISAAPEPELDGPNTRIVLEGDVPSPSNVPKGCAFNTRCPLAQEVCRRERPLLREVAPGQMAACHFAEPNPVKLQPRGDPPAT
ncbi:ABC transporter ATP-binding protein [Pelagovum pacificum]|uniref:ATP-binding cassette domain-containing protein n=1 Tax=Pelagovum pacificum TaxID=2588711 RepID=A0A5C5GES9_9RHOB|nr:oligopeptide/dipeptide ABC transporter ATP-binding protein [Pelagovum pacificum]QQA44324.1 ATP-binding cassette domain-containing protein [Pelagovum pacificum]TNY32557.1 ATP-binding cassette domain-containing protein [Pelagovum pacificum]